MSRHLLLATVLVLQCTVNSACRRAPGERKVTLEASYCNKSGILTLTLKNSLPDPIKVDRALTIGLKIRVECSTGEGLVPVPGPSATAYPTDFRHRVVELRPGEKLVRRANLRTGFEDFFCGYSYERPPDNFGLLLKSIVSGEEQKLRLPYGAHPKRITVDYRTMSTP